LRGESQLAHRFLLQRGGDERGSRIALALFLLDVADDELGLPCRAVACRCGQQAFADTRRLLVVGDGELAHLLAVEFAQTRNEIAFFRDQVGFDSPVLTRYELLDFRLALADQAQRRTLDPARGQSALDLLPQQRRQIEADQIIERAPRLLRVDQLHRHLTRRFDRFLDGTLSDFMENDSIYVFSFQHVTFIEQLDEMPGNRLALAIEVGREIKGIGLLHGLRDRIDMFRVAIDDLVLHFETMRGVYGSFLGQEVAHMTIRGEDFEILTQVFLDRACLSRRLDDD